MGEDSQFDVVKKVCKELECGLASSRDSLQEAFDYALSLVPKEHRAQVTIGLMVYQNSLLKAVVNNVEVTCKQSLTQ